MRFRFREYRDRFYRNIFGDVVILSDFFFSDMCFVFVAGLLRVGSCVLKLFRDK